MFELLQQKISEVVSISDEDFHYFTTHFVQKQIRKRQYLLQEGHVCRYQAFVVKGILRSYTVDEKGGEHILQFATEGWWMADLSSYFTEEPSPFNIDVLEDAQVLLLDKASWEKAMQQAPALERYFRIIIQNHLIATQKRLMQSLTGTAEEKYTKFQQTYPSCVQRIPQHMIASFLGLSRETLSRLKKKDVT